MVVSADVLEKNYKRLFMRIVGIQGGLVAEWLACWTHAQKGTSSYRSRDAVG